MEDNMKKKPIIITVTIVVATTFILTLLLLNRELELPMIKTEDISRVYRDTFDGNVVELDIEEFLSYYNQIYDLRDNKKGEGSTPTCRIVIELKSGKEIAMLNFGDQFEICFDGSEGKRHQYWGKQQEIANMLYKGFYKLK